MHIIIGFPDSELGQKKKTSLFPVAGLKIAMRNAFFFFFFLQFMKKQCAMRFLFF